MITQFEPIQVTIQTDQVTFNSSFDQVHDIKHVNEFLPPFVKKDKQIWVLWLLLNLSSKTAPQFSDHFVPQLHPVVRGGSWTQVELFFLTCILS